MSDLFTDEILALGKNLSALIDQQDSVERIESLNAVRSMLHAVSPFRAEPVDCVVWIPSDRVNANDYNPNTVAPPEMKLLEHSVGEDGYTQPVVAWQREDSYEVVDGFHRTRVAKESAAVRDRLRGYVPLTIINAEREGRGDRIASTIRHNRARGKHRVEAMSDIVVELKRRNWNDDKIARELGMDSDEVLRLTQITGLAEAFKDRAFSNAWEVGTGDEATGEILSDVLPELEADDGDRIFHTWEKWECYRSGFYAERPPEGMTQEQGEEKYREFLSDLPRFEASLDAITREWTHSCEHYLTNDRMNRIAWLGQASVAHALRIPSGCRGGYHRLAPDQRAAADALALKYLNRWLAEHGRARVDHEAAGGRTEAELY